MSRPKIGRDRFSEHNHFSPYLTREDPLKDVDLEAEYEKVMAKTSDLSAKQRRYVVAYHDYMLAKAAGEKK